MFTKRGLGMLPDVESIHGTIQKLGKVSYENKIKT
jgi:hypothetical protein